MCRWYSSRLASDGTRPSRSISPYMRIAVSGVLSSCGDGGDEVAPLLGVAHHHADHAIEGGQSRERRRPSTARRARTRSLRRRGPEAVPARAARSAIVEGLGEAVLVAQRAGAPRARSAGGGPRRHGRIASQLRRRRAPARRAKRRACRRRPAAPGGRLAARGRPCGRAGAADRRPCGRPSARARSARRSPLLLRARSRRSRRASRCRGASLVALVYRARFVRRIVARTRARPSTGDRRAARRPC